MMFERLRAFVSEKPVRAATIAIIASCLAFAVFARPSKKSQDAELLTSSVFRGTIEETVLANAVLEPVRMVNVGAQVTGQIRALHVGLNQRVKAGDLIAEIDSLPQRNALRIAEASLANISAQQKARTIQYAQAENEFRRQKNLLSEQATSRSAFDAAKASYMALEAEVKALTAQMTQARVEVENAQVNLGYTRIVAPIDGVVIAVVTKQGQTLNSTQSVPTIVVLAQLDVMRLKIQISEADVTRVQPGQKVWFNVIGDQNTKRMTTLRLIETAPTTMASDGGAQTTAQSTAAIYYNGLGEIPNPDGKLRPQMTAQANIVLRTATNVLMVPWPALKERGADGRYRVGAETAGGKVQTRFVRIGASDKVNVQIRDGLSLGEKVVIGTAAPAPMDSPL